MKVSFLGQFSIDALWGARTEPVEACAERSVHMFAALAEVHPAFAQWVKSRSRRSGAIKLKFSMPPRVEELVKLLEKGRLFKDGLPRLVEHGGYIIGGWNGICRSQAVSFFMLVGGTSENSEVSNNIMFGMPARDAGNADLLNLPTLRRVVASIVAAWQPDTVSVGPSDYRKFEQTGDYPFFRANWLLYLAPEFAKLAPAPPGVIVEPTADGGALLIATEEQFEQDNPHHVAIVESLLVALQPLEAIIEAAAPPLAQELKRRRLRERSQSRDQS